MKLVAPAVTLSMAAKLVVLLLASALLVLPPDVAAVLRNALSNRLSAALIIYLSRLYMLLR